MTLQKHEGVKQLVLFGEKVAVPYWEGLGEATHAEVKRLLAQLLISVRASRMGCSLTDRGLRDE